ncbi:MAG: ABC transporter ATP-binding protein, partial [Candidatus Marinimicrobia bacterium]|nr:ABC transporter ATP-binding protein [Candidatus Neomarinimicrobiota bacterium]
YDLLLGEFYDETKTVIISTHQVAEIENILQDVIFIDEGKIILHDAVDELKDRWHIYEVRRDQAKALEPYHPRTLTNGLGHVRALVEGSIDLPGAKMILPGLSDIFVALTQKN